MRKKFDVTGMTCAACSARIERKLGKIAGINSISVSLPTNSMTVDFDDNILSDADIIAAVEKAGYGAFQQRSRQEILAEQEAAARKLKIRLWGSIILLIPLFYIGMYHMLPHPQAMAHFFHENPLFYALAQLILVIPICILNRKFFINGFKSLANRSPNMDSLIAVGSSAALIYGSFAMGAIIVGMITNNPALAEQYGSALYFESAGMILSLVTVGKYMEEKSKGRTGTAIEKLLALAPQTVFVERNGELIEISAEELMTGDIAVIKPGGKIPADGIILEGSSSIDESALTGESIPADKTVGDQVFCATTNQTGLLKMKVEQAGGDTLLSQIIRLVEEAAASKAPIAKLADKIALYFVPIVMSISLVTLIIWLIAGYGFEHAFSCAIAVLVISCPCALGLATPVAITVGTGKGAEYGVLIKSGEALQRVHEADTIVFDKTGTLTKGKPQVNGIFTAKDENEFLALAASIEQGSEHLLAQAVTQAAKGKGLVLTAQTDFEALFGRGVACKINEKAYWAGNIKLMQEKGFAIPEEFMQQLEKATENGMTPLLFADEDNIFGLITIADAPKEDAKTALEALKADGMNLVLLTGDNRRTAASVGKKLGIEEIIAEVLPTDKEAKIADLLQNGRKVIMVGDGINDAPALKRASVGIAIGRGTDIAVEAADIVLMSDNISDVVTAIELSQKTIRNIKQNLFWAFFYNSLGIPLAAGVFFPTFGILLNPMIAAGAMSLSSLFVVSNALRLKFFKPKHMK